MASKEDIHATSAHAYPSEHLGHLTSEQETALEKFKEFCQKKQYYRPAEGDSKASHDDETMLRYLRARKWSVQQAWTQFKETEDWRKENHIDQLYEKIDVQEFDVGRRLYPQWTGTRDKRGIPIFVFEIANLTSKAVAAFDNASHKPGEVESRLPPKMLRLFALYESLTNFCLPLSSYIPSRPFPETPVSQSNNIVDVTGVSFKQFWNLKSHMQDASTLATAHYPETLDRIFVVGAPAFFPTIWGWIKRWFDPITVAKIFILSPATTTATLEEFIDRANIPKKYGGDLDYKFGDLPIIDPEIDKNLKWINPEVVDGRNTFPIGPIQWRISPTTGATTATAVGTVDGKPRCVEVASIVKLPPDPSQYPAAQMPSTPPTRPLPRLPNAKDTHPPTPPPGEVDFSNPPSGTTTPASSVRGTPAHTGGGASDPSRAAATSIPYRQPPVGNAASSNGNETSEDKPSTSAPSQTDAEKDQKPSENDLTTTTVRSGTTATRFEQQASTHGDGQGAEQTPEVRNMGHGDEHGVMEPGTVSQAPKEYPLPSPEVEEAGPGVVEQVKSAVGSVAATVIATVGIDHGDKDAVLASEGQALKKQEADKVASEVDQAEDVKVEEFLRSKTRSEQAQKVQD